MTQIVSLNGSIENATRYSPGVQFSGRRDLGLYSHWCSEHWKKVRLISKRKELPEEDVSVKFVNLNTTRRKTNMCTPVQNIGDRA